MVHLKVSPSPSVSLKVEQGRPIYINGKEYQIGAGLKLDEKTNTLSVDTADVVEQDNTKPVTSAAVHTEIGNIEALLAAL